jgi:hypothetical protein
MHLRTSRLVFAAFVGLLAAACGRSIQSVSYVPQPDRVTRPREALSVLVLANTPPGCTSNNGYAAEMFIVKFLCPQGAGTVVLRFGRIEWLRISHEGEWFYVRVHHRGGSDDFYWASKSLEDAQGMVDAITAVAQGRGAPEPVARPPSGTNATFTL